MIHTHKVSALNGLFLRTGPSVNFPKIGLMPYGTPLNVTTTITGWHKLDLSLNLAPSAKVNGTELLQYNPQSPISYGYCNAAFTEPWVPPPPPPIVTGKTRLGVNVITGDMGAAQRAIAAGCNAISLSNNFLGGSPVAENPGPTVMARGYVSGGVPPADPDFLYEGAESANVVYLTPLNEQDVSAYGTPQQIKDRAGFDGEMWRKMKAKGRKYAGGGFSVGTPEFNDPAICQAIQTYYAPLYRDGMAINHHLYSPWVNHPMDIWYEFRWRFFFERCGFDPSPALAGIYCDETGMDQGSVGGFPAVGFTPEQVGAWSRTFLDMSQSNGYGNLLRAAAIFQAGNTTDWRGYNVDSPAMLAAIGAAAQARPTIIMARERMAELVAPPAIQPMPRKIIAQWHE